MGFFTSTSSRTFHVSQSANRARQVVDDMTLEDGAPSGLPPGVFGARTGSGHFNAISPFAAFDSTFEARDDGRGGAYVTERETSFSPIPGAAWFAGVIHDLATDPEGAYHRARSRSDD